MTDEEIEKELLNLCSIDLTDKQNYDNCGRLIIPKYNDIIHKTLDYINRLKDELLEIKYTLDIANNREYRKKFISEIWEKELGNKSSTPDFDFVYKLYFELRKEMQELHDAYDFERKLVDIEREKTAKEILQELKNDLPQGYLGICLWITGQAEKYGIKLEDK